MRYAAVVLDLDGTLLNSDKQVSDRNLSALLRCHRIGMKVIIATGRPPRAVKRFLPEELLGVSSFIYYNGAMISCRHTGISHHEPIEAYLTTEVLDYCLSRNPGLDISLEVEDQWFSLKEYDYATLMRVKGYPIVRPLEELRKFAATKILFSGDMDINPFQAKFGAELNILVTDQGQLVQISSSRASKENALVTLCHRMDITLDQVIVFGDDMNDIGLFNVCGRSIAMGNGVEELKRLSDEITDTNDNDGVAIVLDRID
ncbi:HAD family hydrolase [Paenibacillus lutimineralis]|uniref:HAD family hydrolase n=1 Tax=Paenibacillus lutimineralis TaxID=2707005 RepID=A0A3S9V016_9BACL|nr:HAD family hydrolase [Paenibacillus lutimineralis]AZS15687.1 HAD family hydrolase [Paenibacillus lutimineralis]